MVFRFQKLTVDIYVSAKNFYSIEMDDMTSVGEVCDHLDEITNSKRDPFWTIVEHLDKFNIGIVYVLCSDLCLIKGRLQSLRASNNRLHLEKVFHSTG